MLKKYSYEEMLMSPGYSVAPDIALLFQDGAKETN